MIKLDKIEIYIFDFKNKVWYLWKGHTVFGPQYFHFEFGRWGIINFEYAERLDEFNALK